MTQPMKIASFHLFSQPPWKTDQEVVKDEIDQMVWMEELGFDQVWIGEHNARVYGIAGALQVVAAAVAGQTKRIRIGAAVTRTPLHHPLHVAEDLAMVDIISGGRFDWGIGKGYDHLEFQSYGVDFEEREGRWEEAIDIVLKAWTDGRICHEGKYWNIPETELFPKPVQKPRPPAYLMVSRSDSSAIYAAEHLYPMVLGQGPDWADAKHKLELYGETASKAGFTDADIKEALGRVYQMKQVHVAPTREQAAKEYERGLMWYFDVRRNREMYGFGGDSQPYEFYLDHPSVILGTPGEVEERIAAWRDHTGINNLICWFNCGGQQRDQVRSSMELFSAEVMPQLK